MDPFILRQSQIEGVHITTLLPLPLSCCRIRALPVEPEHLDEQRKLSFHHRDPFDRLLIAQAIAEEIPIVSCDEAFEEYSVRLVWR